MTGPAGPGSGGLRPPPGSPAGRLDPGVGRPRLDLGPRQGAADRPVEGGRALRCGSFGCEGLRRPRHGAGPRRGRPAGTPLARLAAGILLAAALAPAPARGEGEGRYGPLEPKDNEQVLLDNAAAYEERFDRRGYLYDSPGVGALVTAVGDRLAPRPLDRYVRYRFRVLRDPEPGAFALPDGQAYISTGLLAILENEAQVAAVLAHEAQHVAGHHGILSYRSARRKSIASFALGPLTLGAADYFLMRSVMGYSRDLEEEADARGARALVKAGYDPRQMPRLFEILLADPEGERPAPRSPKWSTHPELRARIESTRRQVPGLLAGVDAAGLRVGADGYRRAVRGATLDTIDDLIDADLPRTAVSLARRVVREDGGSARAHLALGDALLALGARGVIEGESAPTDREKRASLRARAWYTRSEREQRRLTTPEGRAALAANLGAARTAYQRALAIEPATAEAHRGLGYVLDNLGDPAGAGRHFVTYLKARPEAGDRQWILNELKAINASLKKEEAP